MHLWHHICKQIRILDTTSADERGVKYAIFSEGGGGREGEDGRRWGWGAARREEGSGIGMGMVARQVVIYGRLSSWILGGFLGSPLGPLELANGDVNDQAKVAESRPDGN